MGPGKKHLIVPPSSSTLKTKYECPFYDSDCTTKGSSTMVVESNGDPLAGVQRRNAGRRRPPPKAIIRHPAEHICSVLLYDS